MDMPRAIRADPAVEPLAPAVRAALRPVARARLRGVALQRLLPRRLVRVGLLGLAALALAALATFAAARWLEARLASAGSPAAAVPAVRKVLVATRDLAPGTRLSATDFTPADWPASAVRPGQFVVADARLDRLEGALLLAPVPAGAPLFEGHVTGGGEGHLSALLRPGMRAIAIPVSASSAVAGLIAPGDRVDLLLTRTLPSGRTVTATVATAVRVLGLDQRLDPAAAAEGGTMVPATVTLEATPRQAEEIALLETLGRVTLALRRPDEAAPDGVAERRAPAWDSDALGLPAGALAPVAVAALTAAGAGPDAAAPPPSPPAPQPAGAAAPRGTRIERGVEVVRGSSFRGDAAPPAEVAP